MLVANLHEIGHEYYTPFLLKEIKKYIENLPHYQTAFPKNRSVEEHMFTARGIIDEKWRRSWYQAISEKSLTQYDMKRY